VTKNKFNVVLVTEIGQPVPAKYAFYPDNNIIEVRKYQLEEQLRVGFDVLVNGNLAAEVDNTDIHFSRMQIDAAKVLVLLIVKSHGLASFG
jgi:hypothetical protein